jgi:hypothetical protein
MTDREKLFAWLDGELPDAEAAKMERHVAADPELSMLAEEHRAAQLRLSSAFNTILAQPVPERLRTATSSNHDNVVGLAARRAKLGRVSPRLPQWASIAATLVLGIFVGMQLPDRPEQPVQVEGRVLYAAADLDRALDTQLASVSGSGSVRIGITFRDSSGAVCRTFTGTEASGLACRDDERWRIRGLFPAPEGQASDYRMAAGMDPTLAALIDSSMAGEAMDARQEAAAKKAGWR